MQTKSQSNEHIIQRRTSKKYSGYHHVDKDPILDQVAEMIRVSGMTHTEIAEKSGVAHSTITKWAMGSTKRPQNFTIEAVIKTLGYERRLVKNEIV